VDFGAEILHLAHRTTRWTEVHLDEFSRLRDLSPESLRIFVVSTTGTVSARNRSPSVATPWARPRRVGTSALYPDDRPGA